VWYLDQIANEIGKRKASDVVGWRAWSCCCSLDIHKGAPFSNKEARQRPFFKQRGNKPFSNKEATQGRAFFKQRGKPKACKRRAFFKQNATQRRAFSKESVNMQAKEQSENFKFLQSFAESY
jgi:hypothetical protein